MDGDQNQNTQPGGVPQQPGQSPQPPGNLPTGDSPSPSGPPSPPPPPPKPPAPPKPPGPPSPPPPRPSAPPSPPPSPPPPPPSTPAAPAQPNVPNDFRGANVPPSNPSLNIRTMQGDLGGPPPKAPRPGRPIQKTKPAMDTGEPAFQPGASGKLDQSFDDDEKRGGKKKMIVIIAILGGIIILALIAYFFLIPIIFPPLVEEPAPTVQTPPPTEQAPPPTTTDPEPTSPTPPTSQHQSFFQTPPAETLKIDLPSADDLFTIKSFLAVTASDSLPDGSFKELELTTDGNQIPFGEFIVNFAKGDPASFINTTQFESDFTAFLYYDAQGVWPGYIARLRPGQTATDAMLNIRNSEDALDINSFYLAAHQPGDLGALNDGQLNEAPTRYAVGSEPGAAFNYGVFNNHFIISTSFEGLKALLPALGL